MSQLANFLVLAMAATFVLLAVESQTPLQFFGYFFGILLFVAVTVNWSRANKRDGTS